LQKAPKSYEKSLYITRFLYKALERAGLEKPLETKHDPQKSWALAYLVFFQEM